MWCPHNPLAERVTHKYVSQFQQHTLLRIYNTFQNRSAHFLLCTVKILFYISAQCLYTYVLLELSFFGSQTRHSMTDVVQQVHTYICTCTVTFSDNLDETYIQTHWWCFLHSPFVQCNLTPWDHHLLKVEGKVHFQEKMRLW